MREQGIDVDFRQDNHSYSIRKGTLRGLHYQNPPHAQAKLIRCVRGRLFDVAVDIRPDSPTFKQWVGVELSAASGSQLFIPAGYAHGFITLEDNTEVIYKVDKFYSPSSEGGVAWDDRDLNISWPLTGLEVLLSAKDELLMPSKNVKFEFEYNGRPLRLVRTHEAE